MNSGLMQNNARKFDLSTIRIAARCAAAAVFAATLSLGVAFAQNKPQKDSPPASASQQKSSKLAVQVVDPQGAVIPNAEVVLSREKNGSSVLQAQGKTDSDGRLQMEGVPEGEYILSVSAKFFLASKQTVTLAAQKTVNLTVQLKIDPKAITIIGLCDPEDPLVQGALQVSHYESGIRLQTSPTPIMPAVAPPGRMRQ